MIERMHLYQAFYCEENIWHLCQNDHLVKLPRYVVFITNPIYRSCLFWNQRAAEPGTPIFWDYHVILLAKDTDAGKWQIWDLDTLLGLPVSCSDYFRKTFFQPTQRAFCNSNNSAVEVPPFFKLITPEVYVRTFSSDRRHMLTPEGAWTAAPPPWPPIMSSTEPNLKRFIDMEDTSAGDVLSLDEMMERFCLTSGIQ